MLLCLAKSSLLSDAPNFEQNQKYQLIKILFEWRNKLPMKNLSKSVLLTSKYQFATNSQIKRDNELKIAKKIKQALAPTFLSVQDTTLGLNSCGSMYKITVESPVFVQKTKVEQWRLVANAISDEMKDIHGFNLKTRIPSIVNTDMNMVNKGKGEQIEQEQDSKKPME